MKTGISLADALSLAHRRADVEQRPMAVFAVVETMGPGRDPEYRVRPLAEGERESGTLLLAVGPMPVKGDPRRI